MLRCEQTICAYTTYGTYLNERLISCREYQSDWLKPKSRRFFSAIRFKNRKLDFVTEATTTLPQGTAHTNNAFVWVPIVSPLYDLEIYQTSLLFYEQHHQDEDETSY